MSTLLNAQVEALGWTLLHSLWQGAALWMLLEAALAWPGLRSPRVRGRLAGGALSLFVLAAAGTYGWVGRAAESVAAERRAETVAKAPAVIVAGPAVDARATAGAVAEARRETSVGADGGDGAPPSKTAGWRERARPAMPWVVGLWIAGVAIGLARHAREWRLLRRLRRGPRAELSPEWRERFAALCARCAPGMRLPRVGETALVRVPQVIGGWAPVILLPAGFLAGLPAAQTEAVLAHELAHLVRRDFWLNALQSLAEAVFFFHPAVHAMNAHVRRERERACDDLAVEWTGDSLGYARALATLAGALPTSPTAASCVLAADGHEPGELRSRIGRLLGRPVAGRVNWAPGGWLVIGAVAAYAALFAASPVIVAQVMSPEERVKVVERAATENRPDQKAPKTWPVYAEAKMTVVSELRTADGSPVPARVRGAIMARSGTDGHGTSMTWKNGRAETTVRAGVVSVLAVPDGWAPVEVTAQAPEAGATSLVLPTMVLRKGRAASFLLRDEAGRPLPGVKVSVEIGSAEAGSILSDGAFVSDANGVLLVPNFDSRFAYELSAEAPGRQNTRLRPANLREGVVREWVLARSRQITGRVVDEATGKGLDGVEVFLRSATNAPSVQISLSHDKAAAVSDADGRFVLPGWDEGGRYGLVFHRLGHAKKVVDARPGDELAVTLHPGGFRLGGSIRLEGGRKAYEITKNPVTLFSGIEISPGSWIGVAVARGVCQRDGDLYRFDFADLPGKETLRMEAAGALSRVIVELRGDSTDLELVLDDKGLWRASEWPGAEKKQAAASVLPAASGPVRSVEIDVVTADKGPLAEGRLQVLVRPSDVPETEQLSYAPFPRKDRRIVLPAVPVGARVEVFCFDGIAGYLIPETSFTVPAGEGAHRREIVAKPAGAVTVEARNARGEAVVPEALYLVTQGAPGLAPQVLPSMDLLRQRVSRRSAGTRWTFANVALGVRYRAVAAIGAQVASSMEFSLDGAHPLAEATVRFGETSPGLVKVVRPDGAPAGALDLKIGFRPFGVGGAGWLLANLKTDSEGVARTELAGGLAGMRYYIEIAPDRDWRPLRVDFAPDAPAPWTLQLESGRTAEGRVENLAKEPVAGARVYAQVESAEKTGESRLPSVRSEETTDAAGRFKFSNLPPGRLRFGLENKKPARGTRFPVADIPAEAGRDVVIVVE